MRHLLTATLFLAATASAQTPQVAKSGLYTGDQFGASVAFSQDLDGDGVRDLLVGAPAVAGSPGAPGYALALSGATGAQIFRFVPLNALVQLGVPGTFGHAIAASTDIDGDGEAEIFVGDPGTGLEPPPSWVVIFSSRSGAFLAAHVGAPGSSFGHALADLGDLDGDGDTNLAAGGPALSGAGPGSVSVLAQNGSAFHFHVLAEGDEVGDQFGFALAAIGDIDLDGTPDALVGAPAGGYARALSGADGSTLFTLPGVGGGFGRTVASAGDNNGDGVPDLAVGAPDFHRVDIHSGSNGAFLRRFEKLGGSFGSSIAPMGDVDGDAFPDLLVGAPADTVLSSANAGAAYVVSGDTGKNLFKFTGDAPGARLGVSAAAADLDGDGKPEMLLGSPDTDPAPGSVGLYAGKLAGSIVSYGLGCPGSFIITPRLDLFGDPLPGGRLTLSLTKGLGGAPAIVALGGAPAVLPLKNGCILWMDPLLVSVPFVLDGPGPGAGTKIFTGEVPLDAPVGLQFTLQVLIADSGADLGIAGTSAFEVTVQ